MGTRSVIAAVVVGLAFVPACASDDGSGACEPTPDFGYDCEPVTDTANVCVGGPTVDGVVHDPSLKFPVSCHAGARTCVGDKVQITPRCECRSGFTGITWACS